MASAGYTKSGPIPEAPAKQMGSPPSLAVEVTAVCVFTQPGTSQRCVVGQEEWGIILQFTGKSQDRNWVSDEVRLVSNHSGYKVGSS